MVNSQEEIPYFHLRTPRENQKSRNPREMQKHDIVGASPNKPRYCAFSVDAKIRKSARFADRQRWASLADKWIGSQIVKPRANCQLLFPSMRPH